MTSGLEGKYPFKERAREAVAGKVNALETPGHEFPSRLQVDKLGMVVPTCNPRTWEAEIGMSPGRALWPSTVANLTLG